MSCSPKYLKEQRKLFIKQVVTHGKGKVKYLGQKQEKDIPIEQIIMYPAPEPIAHKSATEYHSFDFGNSNTPVILKVTFEDRRKYVPADPEDIIRELVESL